VKTDEAVFMRRALALARRGEGLTRPNPPVGAVVMQGDRIVGEGWHRRAGGPHAEVYALRKAGDLAVGSTLYVTLEPCSTQGRTPPCTQLIVDHQVAKVVIGAIDPNPAHAGRAVSWLRRRGVAVAVGVEADAAATLIAPFASRMERGRPYVTLKLGMTLDGKIADRRGASRWITGAAARAEVQQLRRRADAIWVGAGTVCADNPSLWPRPDRSRQPWRVISDTNGITPATATVYVDEHAAHTCVALGRQVAKQRGTAYAQNGATVLPVSHSRSTALRQTLKWLADQGALHVLCEGGGQLAEALIRADLVDAYVLFLAPRIMGGDASVGAVRGKGWLMSTLPEVEIIEQRLVGPDLMIRARPCRPNEKE
jgi:diaminohydroxyphosphoribosylaminopyrimidine deaminase / 5-amino-6-(5-phosphoribosylamino)uracil reductase